MAAGNQGKLFNPRVISICTWLATLPEPDPVFSALQVYCLMVRSWQGSYAFSLSYLNRKNNNNCNNNNKVALIFVFRVQFLSDWPLGLNQ